MPDQRDAPTNIGEFIRFAVVGCLQNGLNLIVFAVVVSIDVPYILASIVAAITALAASFVLNLRWTFGHREGPVAVRAFRFGAVWITIVLFGLLMLTLLVSAGHVPRVPAQAIVILVGAPVSYLAHRRWTFAHTLQYPKTY